MLLRGRVHEFFIFPLGAGGLRGELGSVLSSGGFWFSVALHMGDEENSCANSTQETLIARKEGNKERKKAEDQ